MNVVTIADATWVKTEIPRYISLAQRAMPSSAGHKHFLIAVCPMDKTAEVTEHPAAKMFDHVELVPPEAEPNKLPGYGYFNALRYDMLDRLGIPEGLYVDPDVDIFWDLSELPGLNPAKILWTRSPFEPEGFAPAMKLLGVPDTEPWMNSGFLYLRGNFLAEYKQALTDLAAINFNPRMFGNCAFNVMARRLAPAIHAEVPYIYNVIWHDQQTTVIDQSTNEKYLAWDLALSLHYCNDGGKAYRRMKDATWVYLR